MKHSSPRRVAIAFILTVPVISVAAQAAPRIADRPPAESSESADVTNQALTAEELLEGSIDNSESPRVGGEFSYYDADGYPEDAEGRLVLVETDDGPAARIEGDDFPYLLYAQYVNTQRDAVILSRTGDRVDTLPSGELFEIPQGYGALKSSAIYASILEARPVPHFSDAVKTYTLFPLSDVYLGLSFGITGLQLTGRYVWTEQLAIHARTGINATGGESGSLRDAYWVPVHVGAGYRFPGLFEELLGSSLWTVGGDLFLGIGDRDGSTATPVFFMMPGLFFEFEKVLLFDTEPPEDFRTDPRPENYSVTTVGLRAGLHLNLLADSPGGVVYPWVELGVSFNLVGPPIPEHEFKETRIIYMHDLYREDLQRQIERREARENRG